MVKRLQQEPKTKKHRDDNIEIIQIHSDEDLNQKEHIKKTGTRKQTHHLNTTTNKQKHPTSTSVSNGKQDNMGETNSIKEESNVNHPLEKEKEEEEKEETTDKLSIGSCNTVDEEFAENHESSEKNLNKEANEIITVTDINHMDSPEHVNSEMPSMHHDGSTKQTDLGEEDSSNESDVIGTDDILIDDHDSSEESKPMEIQTKASTSSTGSKSPMPLTPNNVFILDSNALKMESDPKDSPSGESETETVQKPTPDTLSYCVDFAGPKKIPFLKRLFLSKNENAIKTTKYRWWSFLFWSVIFQYKELSNIYFLIIMILACIPTLSPTSPITSILPVIFILGSGLLRDAIQEIIRALEDRKANRSKTRALNRDTGEIVDRQAQQIRVGDILYIKNGEEVPADILVISSSNDSGICYCETSNLDGESNMKLRLAKESMANSNTTSLVNQIKGIVHAEKPHKLYQFKGKLELKASSLPTKQIEDQKPLLDIQKKAMSDQDRPELIEDKSNEKAEQFPSQSMELSKDSPQEDEDIIKEPLTTQNTMFRGSTLQNTDFIYGLVLYTGRKTKLFLNLKKTKSKFSYMQYTLNVLFIGIIIINILANLLLTSLSLYQQAVYWQEAWYVGPSLSESPSFTTALANCGTTIILLNLMIPMSLYVSLEFVKMLQAWFFNRDANMYYEGKPMKVYSSNLNTDLAKIDIIFSDKTGTLTENIMEFKKIATSKECFDDESLLKKDDFSDDLARLFECIVLCHTIIPNEDHDGQIHYEGESPDEVALVEAAAKYGFRLVDRTDSKIAYATKDDNIHHYSILAVLPFSSDRKRMSVLVRNQESNEIRIFTKGADSVMIKLAEGDSLSPTVKKNVDMFGSEGLRTLLLGSRVIAEDEYESWSAIWHEAETLIEGREEAMESAAKDIEINLTILGATGIEDKLQDRVPETVDFFVAAGIQIWMLTGDKMETAINIAGSAHMVDKDTKIFRITVPSTTISNSMMTQLSNVLAWTSNNPETRFALAIEGNATEIILKAKSSALLPIFLQVVRGSQTIICCRSTPLQKSNLVTLAKRQFKKIGLAIGDGANDVSMIQSARVGVGIHGREGSQAARAADFAIGRFYMLKRLLAVHGHYSLYRSSLFVQYSFYKNFSLTLLQIFYCVYNGFTMAVITDSYIVMFYNMIFTLLLPFVMGLFDKDIDEHVLESSPELYNRSKKEPIFGIRTTLWWFSLSLYHAVLVFFVTMYASADQPNIMGIHSVAFTSASALNIVVVFKAVLELKYHTIIHYLCVAFSLLSLPAFYIIYALIIILPYYETGDGYFIAFYNYTNWTHWAIILIVTIASIIPDVTYKVFKLLLRPSTVDSIRMQHLKAGFVVKVPKDGFNTLSTASSSSTSQPAAVVKEEASSTTTAAVASEDPPLTEDQQDIELQEIAE